MLQDVLRQQFRETIHLCDRVWSDDLKARLLNKPAPDEDSARGAMNAALCIQENQARMCNAGSRKDKAEQTNVLCFLLELGLAIQGFPRHCVRRVGL